MNAPARHAVLPPTLAPRGLSRVEAAAYIGVAGTKFDEMVADGRMPQPKLIDDVEMWDRLMLPQFNATPRVSDPRRPWAEHDFKAGVYFVGFGDYVKIGVSASLGGRLRELSTQVPEAITLHAFIPGATIKEERDLHRRFKQHRLKGEWFRAGEEIMAYIGQVKAGNL